MAKQRGAVRYFRIGREADETNVANTAYGTPAQGYTNAAVSGSGNDMRYFQVSEGNFSLGQNPISEEQPVLRGQRGVHYREKTGYSIQGDIAVLAHPEEVKYFLDAGLYRDSTQELCPHTIQEFYPGIDSGEAGVSYIGCKCSQIAGAWGSGTNRIILTTSWTGQREASVGALDPLASITYTKPSNGYVFSTSALVDFGTAIALPSCNFTDVNFTIANGLAEGPRCFNEDATLRGAITDLVAGQERMSGSATLQWTSIDIMTWLRNFTDLVFRSIFIHPTSDNSITVTGAETAGDNVLIEVNSDPTSLLAVDDVIAFQHKSGGATTTQWTTAKVTAVATGPNTVTVDTLDVALSADDVIWTEALEIRFNTVNITGHTKTGGPDDAVITVQVNLEGKSDSSGNQITYSAKGAGLPST